MRFLSGFAVVTVMFVSAAGGALSQTPPCEDLEHRSDFDFWVGEWNVSTPDGRHAGTNSITKSPDGCLIEENWTSANGGTGMSMNFYDPLTQKWRQIWMGLGFYIDYSGELNSDGAMVLEGEIFYQAQQARFPFRGVWTPNADGSVTQHFTQQDPATGEWSDWFIGRYVRQETE